MTKKKKIAPKTKAKAAGKAKPRAKAKVVAKPKPKMVARKSGAKPKAAAPAPLAPKTNFMWKLLERKEAELKRRELARASHGSDYAGQTIHADAGHARFHGPRRKAA